MPDWVAIRLEWETSELSLSDLARKHQLKISTVKSRRLRENWWRPKKEKIIKEKIELFPYQVKRFIENNAKGKSVDELRNLVNATYQANYTSQQIVSFKLRNKIRSFEVFPIGAERTLKSGTVMIKVSNQGTYEERWQQKSRYIWELHYGKIPATHVVIFLDQNKQNVDIDNLMLISKKQLAVINKHKLLFDDAVLNKSSLQIVDVLLALSERRKR